jgi:hypothetical protein
MSYIILKGRWCDIIIQNVHAPTEDKDDDIKDSFYEEIEQVFFSVPKVPYENLGRRLQCKCREGGSFQTNNW